MEASYLLCEDQISFRMDDNLFNQMGLRNTKSLLPVTGGHLTAIQILHLQRANKTAEGKVQHI